MDNFAKIRGNEDGDEGIDREPGHFTHTLVSAKDAAPLTTRAASSVFALGAAADAGAAVESAVTPPTPKPGKKSKPARRVPEDHKLLAAIKQGRLNRIGIAGVLQCVPSVADRVIKRLVDAGGIHRAERVGTSQFYEFGPAPRAPKSRHTDPSAPSLAASCIKATQLPVEWHAQAQAVVHVRTPSPSESEAGPAPAPVSCALFNTGELLIELGDNRSMRLTKPQVTSLVAYLDQISSALRAA